MLTGIQSGEVREVISRVFSPEEFDLFLYERLEYWRSRRVQDGPFDQVVAAVVQDFGRNGRDAELIAEVAAVRPLRTDVQDVYNKYARALLNEARQEAIEQDQLALLEKFGLVPQVELRRGGRPQFPTSVFATFEGFQKRVKDLLPMFNPRPWFAQFLQNEQRVCQIEVSNRAVGSGFLVGPRVVLTNHHVLKSCIDSKASGRTIGCRFDYRLMTGGAQSQGTVVRLEESFEEWHLDSSPGLSDREEDAGKPAPTLDELDHALVRLEREFGAEPVAGNGPARGWIEVPAHPAGLEVGGAVMILQYPGGEPVKLAFDTEAVQSINAKGTRVRYATNSDFGSSGSPCFNIYWGLIALHHFGDPFHKPARYNQGVPVGAIWERLARDGKTNLLGEATG
jgi:hypothetical protein